MNVGKGRRGVGRWLGLYTGLYLCGALALWCVLALHHKRLIWYLDGVKQHYTVLGYVGQALRGLLEGRGLPMFSFSLGQGMDVLTTCAYYGYTDPLSLLAALAGPKGLELAYMATVALRDYLSGLCFALYAKRVGAKDSWALGCSAAIYVSCGYFLYLSGRHPYFINGALYLPLLLLGVERVLDGRRWLTLTLVMALMVCVNFYFAYMNILVAILYILARLVARLPRRGLARSAGDGFALLGSALLGLALSAAVLLPVALLYLRNSRMGVASGYAASMLHYPLREYFATASRAFLSWGNVSNYTVLSFAPLALFGLLGLLTQRGGRARQLRAALAVALAMACVPAVGKVMNGMGYVSNRWVYALAMFVALGCCFGLPQLFRRDAPKRWMAVPAAAYALATAWLYRRKPLMLAESALLLAHAALLLAWAGNRLGKCAARRGMTALLAASIALYAAAGYLPMGGNYISEQAGQGVYEAVATESKGQLIADDGVYRVDQARFDDANAPLLGYMGTSFYWSLVDGGLSDYYRDLWLPMQQTTYHIYGLYGSAPMNGVASVKYSVRGASNAALVPYGFDPAGEPLELPDGSAAQAYENEYALPLGYAYDARLDKADYDALPVEDKLQALTRCAIVEASAPGAEAIPLAAFEGGAVDVPWEAASAEGVRLTEGGLHAVEGGTLTLAFDAPEDCEIYLLADGIRLERADSKELWVRASTAAGECDALLRNPTDNFYFDRKGWALCLGSDGPKECELLFYNCAEADVTFRALRIVAIPLEGYRRDMAARRAEALEDVALGDDRLTGRISVAGDRVLQIAVPYSPGWRAWVDGAERPVFRCGGMYMGVTLGAGEHQIEMRYETPGLRAGMAISAAALLLAVALAVGSAVKRRRERKGVR